MVVKLQKGGVWKITCIVVLLLGLFLGGCGNFDWGEVQAQTDRGVKTYEILPNTFDALYSTEHYLQFSSYCQYVRCPVR